MINKLNKLYGDFLSLQIEPTTLPDVGLGGLTLVEGNPDAFILADSVAGRSLSILPPKEDKYEQGLVRQTLGLAFANRIAENQMLGFYELALLKNSMLAQAAQHFNLTMFSNYDWTFKMPDGNFFRETSNPPVGYEIRLYICKKQGTNS